MSSIIMQPVTLADVYHLYCKHLQEENPTALPNLKTALVRYTLPGYGLPPEAKKDTADAFMTTVPLYQFKDALNVQQRVYESLGDKCSPASKRNYRHALKKMLDWCSQQKWWKENARAESGEYAPIMRKGSGRPVRATNRNCFLPKYTLKDSEILGDLQKELDSLMAFLTGSTVYKRQDPPLRKVTAVAEIDNIKRIMGWLHRYRDVAISELTLSKLDDIELAYEFCNWLKSVRKVTPGSEVTLMKAWLNVLKFLHYKESNAKKYRDIQIVEDVRYLINEKHKIAITAPPVSNESLKWLEWEEYLGCVQQLKKECASKQNNGQIRPDSAIALSYQRYLIFALLSVFPDRQRTLRELEFGRTFVERDNSFFIEHNADDFKTGKSFCKEGKKRIIEIPKELHGDLEEWINKWRKVFNPTHNYVFTQKNGKPFDGGSFWAMFKAAAYRITGKATNPHLVRDMIVTHLKKAGTPGPVMDSLAELMAHSSRAQCRSYDRRTHQEKVAPALEVLRALSTTNTPPSSR